MTTTVMLVDDHPIVLSGLSALITSDSTLELLTAVRSGTEARSATQAPDVAVVDLDLLDGDGIELGADLKAKWPRTKVVVLTMHADDAAVMRCLGAGLDGYLLKDADPDDILAAVHTVAGGTMVVGSGVAPAVVAAAASIRTVGSHRLEALDARELEILDLLVEGLTTSQVAARLFLAHKTIRNRISEILKKLQVATREEAVTVARASGPARRRPT